MDLILYYIRVVFSSLFSKKRTSEELLVMLMLLLLIGGYSLGFIFALDKISEYDLVGMFYKGSLSTAFFLPLILSYVFSFESLKQWVHPLYPVKGFTRYSLHLLQEWISELPLLFLLWSLAMSLFSAQIEWFFVLKMAISLHGGLILKRTVHTLFELRPAIRKQRALFIIPALLAGGLLWQVFPLTFDAVAVSDLLLLIALTLFGYGLEEGLFVPQADKSQNQGKVLNISTNLRLLKKGYAPLIMAILFKGFLLWAFYISLSKGDAETFLSFSAMKYLFITPVILFTYVFNNSWGYFRHYWYQVEISQGSPRKVFFYYLRLFRFPLSIDMLMTVIFIIVAPEWMKKTLIIYPASTFLLIIIGFFWSVYSPKFVKKSLSFGKQNASMAANLCSMLIAFTFIPLEYVDWYVYLIPLYIIGGAGFLLLTFKEYPKRKEKLFLTIFK